MSASALSAVWRPAPAALTLEAGCVDVWLADIEPESRQVAAHRKLLSNGERARARRFLHDSKRKEYIVTRGLLKGLLLNPGGIDLSGRDFDYNAYGKPCLPGRSAGSELAFNVSHAHGMALIALTLGGNLGVDLEKIRARVDWRALAERFFSKAEYQALQACPPARRQQSFFTCWTRKEALVKGVGAGIAHGFDNFDVSLDPHETRCSTILRGPHAATAEWTITSLPTPPPYSAAVALDRPRYRVRTWRISAPETR